MNFFKGNDIQMLMKVFAIILFFKGSEILVDSYVPNLNWYYYIILGLVIAVIFKIKLN